MNLLPTRKNIRLAAFNYEKNGMFFITICTKNKKCILGTIKHDHLIPSEIGQDLLEVLREASSKETATEIIQYVVMPNHVHLLVL